MVDRLSTGGPASIRDDAERLAQRIGLPVP
jgi:hypothetical protein